jgi:hypothetical protein
MRSLVHFRRERICADMGGASYLDAAETVIRLSLLFCRCQPSLPGSFIGEEGGEYSFV